MTPARRYRVSQTCRMPNGGKIGENSLPDRARLIGLCSNGQIVLPDQMDVKGF
jgi:hypothetical protein